MDYRNEQIAIVGASAIFPGSISANGFWDDILAGKDMVRDIPESHWLIDDYYDPDPKARDKTYAHRGAFLDHIDFDPLEWGVPPSIVPATDTTQLLALVVAKQVLIDASQGQFKEMDKSRISCILGVTSAQELLGTMVNRLQRPVWVKAMRELGYAEEEVQVVADRIGDNYVPWQESTFPGLLGNVVAGRIANRLDLGGTNCVTDAACASSFSALSMAVNELRLGQCDVAITGGADTMNDIFMYMCFSKTPALSPTGDCRPFSDRADGTLLGEGIGMVALKRLSDAQRDGDRIYSIITGVGSSSDGRSKSVYAPVPKGQAVSLRRAYAAAGYDADTVELIEAHGTGTKAGDAAEFEGLSLAFRESGRTDNQWCALGTVKSQLGHTKASAGAAGLFKAVMALHHKVLPPTIKIDKPNPKLDIENQPFYLNTETRPWIRSSDHPRRASVSSFGFGGSNFHIALEEYTGDNQAWRHRVASSELVIASADSAAALADAARGLSKQAALVDSLVFLARTTQESYDTCKAHRLAIVADSDADLAAKLDQAAKLLDSRPNDDITAPNGIYLSHNATAGDVGFLFPGQGSQYLAMGNEVANTWKQALDAWDEAADLDLDGSKLHHVVFPVPVFSDDARRAQDAKLRATEWAQPAIGVASLSYLGLLNAMGVTPTAVGGHSYGEITALAAAGAISTFDMIRIARKRGELMTEASKADGAMTAVPRDLETVRPIAKSVEGVVLANHNGPKQVVLSGPTAAIEAVEAKLVAAGIEPKRLQVATAFHSSIVASASAPFHAFLKDVKVTKPNVPVWSNAKAAVYSTKAADIRKGLADQITSPVRFVQQIQGMYDAGIRTFIEVGPGRILTNLVGEILDGQKHRAINLDRRRKPGVTSFNHALAQMAIAGVPMNLAVLWESFTPAADPADKTQPKLCLKLNGANYDKPYPPKGGTAALPKPNPVRVGAAAARDLGTVKEVQVIKEVIKEVRVEVPVPVPAAPGVAMSNPNQPANPFMQPAAAQTQAPSAGDAQWMAAFTQVQAATANAHSAYQQAMATSHMAFLQSAEMSLAGLNAVLTGQPAAAGNPYGVQMPVPPQMPVAQAPAFTPAPPVFAPAHATAPVSMVAPIPTASSQNTWSPTPAASSEASMLVQSGVDVVSAASAANDPAVVRVAVAGPAVDLEA
ncbi:MAG: acyltransferase domain-containing protein, partial [Rhodobacterales bacterium]|nr:acyltransferase domain-containing protein [Rhodobacterales bacterium]